MITARSASLFSRPFHGLCLGLTANPSDESLGYFQSSANADSGVAAVCATPSPCILEERFKRWAHLLNSAGIDATTNQGQHIQSLEIALLFKDQFLRAGPLFALRTRKVRLTKLELKQDWVFSSSGGNL